MLDTLPVELIRRILTLAAPHPARTPAFAESLLERQRFLCGCMRVDHLLVADGNEGGLVRTFRYEYYDDDDTVDIDLDAAICKMPNLDEIDVRRGVEGDLSVLIVEANKLELRINESATANTLPTFPRLKHLVLHGVTIHSILLLSFFNVEHLPALKTFAFSRVTVNDEEVFPPFPPNFFQPLHLHVSLSELTLHPHEIYTASERTSTSVDERSGNTVLEALAIAGDTGDPTTPRKVAIGSKTLVLSPEEITLDFTDDRVTTAPALVLVSALIRAGRTKTLFRPRNLRVNGPMYMSVPLPVVYAREAKVIELWGELDEACQAAEDLEVYFLDSEADVALWPDWAKENISLRRLVAQTEERDAGVEKRQEAASQLMAMLFGPRE